MSGILEWAKSHKLLAAATVAGILGLFALLKRGGGGGGVAVVNSGPPASVQAAAIQAGAAQNAAIISAQLQRDKIQADYNAHVQDLTLQAAVASKSADLRALEITAAAGVQNNQTQAQLSLADRQAQAQIAALTIDHDTRIGLANIEAGTAAAVADRQAQVLTAQLATNAHMFETQLQTDVAKTKIQSDAAIVLNQTNADLQHGIVASNASVAINQQNVLANIQALNIAASITADNNKRAEIEAQIAAELDKYKTASGVAIVQIDATKDLYNSAIQANAGVQSQYINASAQAAKDQLDAILASQGMKYSFDQNTINLISSGKIKDNDAIAALAIINGQPQVAQSVQSVKIADNFGGNSFSSIINGIGNLFKSFTGAFA